MLKQLHEGHDQVPIRNLIRPAYFVPETKKLDDLLREIRQNHTHMAIVVDEYGSVAGLATIEDLMEEIVGDIQDEYDHEEVLYEKINDDEYIFNAKINIYDFSELMGLKLEGRDYETLGGFVYAQLDKIPVAGDAISFENLAFTVLATRGRRILKVRVVREHAQEDEVGENETDMLLLLPPQAREKQIEQKEEEGVKRVENPSTSSDRYEYRGA
jgi:CBS domain containing-hemolysin-like protein